MVEYGPDTFVIRMADDSMAPRIRRGDFVYVDPDQSAVPGRFVALRGPGGERTVRRCVEEDGRRVLRALAPGWPESVLDAEVGTLIEGVVVFAGRAL